MSYKCDICGKSYTKKRNLKQHVSEKHYIIRYWNCCEDACAARFIRRSYLVSHLERFHKISKVAAREKSVTSSQRTHILEGRNTIDVPDTKKICSCVEDVSDDDSVLDLVEN